MFNDGASSGLFNSLDSFTRLAGTARLQRGRLEAIMADGKSRVKHAPHRVRRFKVSTDPEFTKKIYDVTGLYMNPPDRAVVLSIDEKTQI